MANIQHASIPDAYLHEPKGVAGASAGKVYVSNGLGSGVWTTQTRYGELYIAGGTSSKTLSAASAYSILNPTGSWQAGEVSGVTLTAANGTITVLETGVYNLSFWVVFTTDSVTAGTRYSFKYAVNGITGTRIISTGKETNGVDTLDLSASGIASLTAGDVISIYVAGDTTSSGTNIVPIQAGFTLHKA